MTQELNPVASARLLRDAQNAGAVIDSLAGELLPATVDQGYAIQAALADLIAEPVAGWKIAATAQAGRDHINVDRPLAGRLFASMVGQNGSSISLNANRMRVAEAEIVLKLGSDLLPGSTPVTESEAAAAIASVHPGLEFPDSRFADFTQVGAACLIADNACASRFVLGPAAPAVGDPAALAGLATTLWINDQAVTTGHGSDALGGPLKALVWLANTLGELGIALRAGQFITTGVTGKPSPVAPGDQIRVDLDEFGVVSAVLTGESA